MEKLNLPEPEPEPDLVTLKALEARGVPHRIGFDDRARVQTMRKTGIVFRFSQPFGIGEDTTTPYAPSADMGTT